MTDPDYDDPEIEASWISGTRSRVGEYLSRQALKYGPVGDWPAWHVAPVVSVWAVQSLNCRGVGWWVITGDLPTDYVHAAGIESPREAVAAFACRWADYVAACGEGRPPAEYTIGDGSDELLPPLESRARALQEWASDDELWA